MKHGKKLLRKHKEFLSEQKLDWKEFLLERDTADIQGKYFVVININTGKMTKFYY